MLEKMKRALASLVIGLPLLIGSMIGASAQDTEKALRAFESGDYVIMLREVRPLAESGNATAQFFMGVGYDEGKGVLQDYKEALKWYRLAAEQGHGKAQFNLGVMYVKGEGITQDNVMAHMWLNISSSNGIIKAAESRDYLAKRMSAAEISKAHQLARECVAKKYKGC